ncbi:hypothetical protein IFR04_001479 [Cadophora malorum]|uniref:Uncharacterized protein n=1 Tax=Cadophora malorum TaxID=108018 RepID=A0A8H7WID6_9HELO|nr:hypothetical protein IFR04_001479 [Cadophora malorum]
MKTFTVTAILAIAASLVQAAPAQQTRQFEAQLTFIGAADGSFTLAVPTDGTVFPITNDLSVSKIASLGGATCAFDGVDGSHTVLVGAQTVDVGPPQVQVSGSCRAF